MKDRIRLFIHHLAPESTMNVQSTRVSRVTNSGQFFYVDSWNKLNLKQILNSPGTLDITLEAIPENLCKIYYSFLASCQDTYSREQLRVFQQGWPEREILNIFKESPVLDSDEVAKDASDSFVHSAFWVADRVFLFVKDDQGKWRWMFNGFVYAAPISGSIEGVKSILLKCKDLSGLLETVLAPTQQGILFTRFKEQFGWLEGFTHLVDTWKTHDDLFLENGLVSPPPARILYLMNKVFGGVGEKATLPFSKFQSGRLKFGKLYDISEDMVKAQPILELEKEVGEPYSGADLDVISNEDIIRLLEAPDCFGLAGYCLAPRKYYVDKLIQDKKYSLRYLYPNVRQTLLTLDLPPLSDGLQLLSKWIPSIGLEWWVTGSGHFVLHVPRWDNLPSPLSRSLSYMGSKTVYGSLMMERDHGPDYVLDPKLSSYTFSEEMKDIKTGCIVQIPKYMEGTNFSSTLALMMATDVIVDKDLVARYGVRLGVVSIPGLNMFEIFKNRGNWKDLGITDLSKLTKHFARAWMITNIYLNFSSGNASISEGLSLNRGKNVMFLSKGMTGYVASLSRVFTVGSPITTQIDLRVVKPIVKALGNPWLIGVEYDDSRFEQLEVMSLGEDLPSEQNGNLLPH